MSVHPVRTQKQKETQMLSNHTDFSKFTDSELEATLERVDVELKEIQNTRKQIVETG